MMMMMNKMMMIAIVWCYWCQFKLSPSKVRVSSPDIPMAEVGDCSIMFYDIFSSILEGINNRSAAAASHALGNVNRVVSYGNIGKNQFATGAFIIIIMVTISIGGSLSLSRCRLSAGGGGGGTSWDTG